MWNSDLDLCLTLPAYDQDDSEVSLIKVSKGLRRTIALISHAYCMQVDKDFQTDVIQTVAKLLGEHRSMLFSTLCVINFFVYVCVFV